MGMNIKNPEAHALAREIAARTGLSLTDAVLAALREKRAALAGRGGGAGAGREPARLWPATDRSPGLGRQARTAAELRHQRSLRRDTRPAETVDDRRQLRGAGDLLRGAGGAGDRSRWLAASGAEADLGGQLARMRDQARQRGRRRPRWSSTPSSTTTGIEVGAATPSQARAARLAHRRFGKGRHPARLNLGDCFAYALARETGEPLLARGTTSRHRPRARPLSVTPPCCARAPRRPRRRRGSRWRGRRRAPGPRCSRCGWC